MKVLASILSNRNIKCSTKNKSKSFSNCCIQHSRPLNYTVPQDSKFLKFAQAIHANKTPSNVQMYNASTVLVLIYLAPWKNLEIYRNSSRSE